MQHFADNFYWESKIQFNVKEHIIDNTGGITVSATGLDQNIDAADQSLEMLLNKFLKKLEASKDLIIPYTNYWYQIKNDGNVEKLLFKYEDIKSIYSKVFENSKLSI
jgi:hypothetical protein